MSKRRTHYPELKARVSMEAIQEIAADNPIMPSIQPR